MSNLSKKVCNAVRLLASSLAGMFRKADFSSEAMHAIDKTPVLYL